MRLQHVLPLAALATVVGCATTIRGTGQHIAVATDPPGARCVLRNERNDATWTVSSTPEDIEIRRDRSALEVRCAKDGYFESVEAFDPVRCGITHCEGHAKVAGSAVALGTGAALLGGVTLASAAPTLGGGLAVAGAGAAAAPLAGALVAAIPVGGAIDFASGAAFEYPPQLAILMVPSRFQSEDARNAYFTALERRLERAFADRKGETEKSCARWNCGYFRREDEAWIAGQRASLARRREMASIDPEATRAIAP